MPVNLKKITIVIVLIFIAVFSYTRIAPWVSDPETHVHTIAQTEEKISTVTTLSGGAAATSATLSLLPGDMCTPIAEQLAELATYFVLILSALYLEKYLITLSGFISFCILIPLACLIMSLSVIFDKKNLQTIAAKIAILGLVISIIVPVSVLISDMIYETQESNVESTIEEYNGLDIEGDADSGLFSEFTTITTETVDKITDFVSSLLESLAVMIVVSCIVPLLVFVFLVWLIKTIFASNVLSLDADSIKQLTQKDKKD